MSYFILFSVFLAGFLAINDRKQRDTFLMGWIFFICASSLVQDSLGREEFLTVMSTGWVSSWYTVPAVILVLIWGMWSIRTINRSTITITIKKEVEP